MTKNTASVRVSPAVAFVMSGSDISNPSARSGYDESIAAEFVRTGVNGGTYQLSAIALADLAEFCNDLAVAESNGGSPSTARALRLCRDNALAAAETIPERAKLHDVYMFIVRNWAVNAEEIPGDRAFVEAALKTLTTTGGLVEPIHVNGEAKLTYQSMFDYENDDNAEADAEHNFNECFPEDAPVTVATTAASHAGASGPRYTDVQLYMGVAARAAGLSWPQVAEVAGVKSPSYFSKVVRAWAFDRDPKDMTA
jgi:hypothetical protein